MCNTSGALPISRADESLSKDSDVCRSSSLSESIEDVYWHHRIWPKERPNPKPSLDSVMPQAQLEKKVEDYLRNSQALEDQRQGPLTAEQLQAEIERMARNTKQPGMLRELFESARQ